MLYVKDWPNEEEGANGLKMAAGGGGGEAWVGEVGVSGPLSPKIEPSVDEGAAGVIDSASRPNRSSAADFGKAGAGFSNAGAVGTAAGLTWFRMLGGIRLGGSDAGNESRPSRLLRCCRIRYMATANSSLDNRPAELISARSQICANASSGSLDSLKNGTASSPVMNPLFVLSNVAYIESNFAFSAGVIAQSLDEPDA